MKAVALKEEPNRNSLEKSPMAKQTAIGKAAQCKRSRNASLPAVPACGIHHRIQQGFAFYAPRNIGMQIPNSCQGLHVKNKPWGPGSSCGPSEVPPFQAQNCSTRPLPRTYKNFRQQTCHSDSFFGFEVENWFHIGLALGTLMQLDFESEMTSHR